MDVDNSKSRQFDRQDKRNPPTRMLHYEQELSGNPGQQRVPGYQCELAVVDPSVDERIHDIDEHCDRSWEESANWQGAISAEAGSEECDDDQQLGRHLRREDNATENQRDVEGGATRQVRRESEMARTRPIRAEQVSGQEPRAGDESREEERPQILSTYFGPHN